LRRCATIIPDVRNTCAQRSARRAQRLNSASTAARARWLESVRALKKAGLIDKFPCGKKKGSPQRVPKTGDKIIDKAQHLIRNGYGTAPRLPMRQVVELLRLVPPTRDEQLAAIRNEHDVRPQEAVATPEVRPPEPVTPVLTPREPAENLAEGWPPAGGGAASGPTGAARSRAAEIRGAGAPWPPFEEKIMAWGKPILRTEPKSVCDPHKPRCCDQPTTGDASISDLRADGCEPPGRCRVSDAGRS